MRKAKARQPRPDKQRTVDRALEELAVIDEQVKAAHEAVAHDLQTVLDTLAGVSFSSHDNALAVTRLVQDLMQRLGKRAKCPKTGEPCNLRCTRAGRGKVTVFQFERIVAGRRKVTATSGLFPDIKLVPAPPDRRKRPART